MTQVAPGAGEPVTLSTSRTAGSATAPLPGGASTIGTPGPATPGTQPVLEPPPMTSEAVWWQSPPASPSPAPPT